MSEKKINLMPLIGSILLILLYLASLRYRGFLSEREYHTALLLREFYPDLTGTFLPKIPAALATLATGALLWLAAYKYRMLHPGIAPGLYLVFPPVWWIGTSCSAEPLFVLSVTLAATGIFISRRAKNIFWKIAGFAGGATGAAASAVLIRFGYFTVSGILLSLLPAIFFIISVKTEKTDGSDPMSKRLNHLALFLAVIFIALLGLLITPAICRFLKISAPEYLNIFAPGELLYRPALALLAPMLWLYLAREAKKYEDKISLILIAIGFVMLTLPPALPWHRFTSTLQYNRLQQLQKEFNGNIPVFFADSNTAPALRYTFDAEIIHTGWAKNELSPVLLKNALSSKLKTSDAAVIYDRGELDNYLPRINNIKYTLNNHCQMYLFPKNNNNPNREDKK